MYKLFKVSHVISNFFKKEPTLLILLTSLVVIKLIGVLIATKIFASFTPLIDSNLYLINFYENHPMIRTKIVQNFAYSISRFVNPFFSHFIFGLISVLGYFYYYLRGGRSWLILLFLLLPSSLVWTSIVGKEALFFGGMGLCLFIWSKFSIEPLDRYDLVFLIIGFCLCILLRPHYGIVLVWLFASTLILKHFEKYAIMLLLIIFLVVTVAIYYFVWSELSKYAYGGIDFSARASRFVSLGIEPGSSLGLEKFKSLIPLGVIMGIIGPLPSEVIARFEFTPYFVEGVLILLLPFMIAMFALKRGFVHKAIFFRKFWFCLMTSILYLMVLHAPFGVLNPGSAIRWRTNFEQFIYLAPFLLLLKCMNEKK